jgi:hypothetical protein
MPRSVLPRTLQEGIDHSYVLLGDGLRIIVFALVFAVPVSFFLALANPLRLQQMESQGKTYIKALTAEPAANWKLQQSQSGNVGETHP